MLCMFAYLQPLLIHDKTMSFSQSLHATDPGGAALLPRQQCHPQRRQGISSVYYKFKKLWLQNDCGLFYALDEFLTKAMMVRC